jgi:hypothetical protein
MSAPSQWNSVIVSGAVAGVVWAGEALPAISNAMAMIMNFILFPLMLCDKHLSIF